MGWRMRWLSMWKEVLHHEQLLLDSKPKSNYSSILTSFLDVSLELTVFSMMNKFVLYIFEAYMGILDL